MSDTITIGTRGSGLARWQADHVAAALRRTCPTTQVEVRVIKTKGDRILDVPLSKIGDKGLFTKELETALLEGEVDLCVHSMKDMPSVMPAGCALGALLPRADARDALVCGPRIADARTLADVPDGARIGTGSLRRTAQLRARYPQIKPAEIRGNIDTRLAKGEGAEYEGVILAASGVERMGWGEKITYLISVEEMIPAVGQGAIGLEIRQDDTRIIEACRAIACSTTEACVFAERHIMRELEGGCQVPIGAFVRIEDSRCILDATVLSLDGTTQARTHLEAIIDADQLEAEVALTLARRALKELRAQGAEAILAAVREEAAL